MTYQLDIIGDDMSDLVRHAGGWIYDRVAAGWEVTVLLPFADDPRPMRILGAHSEVVDPVRRLDERCPQAIAASARLCDHDSGMTAALLTALHTRDAEVTLWGEPWPADLQSPPVAATHRLSLAARAFKSQALAASGAARVPVGAYEVFRTATAVHSWVGADLVTAG